MPSMNINEHGEVIRGGSAPPAPCSSLILIVTKRRAVIVLELGGHIPLHEY